MADVTPLDVSAYVREIYDAIVGEETMLSFDPARPESDLNRFTVRVRVGEFRKIVAMVLRKAYAAGAANGSIRGFLDRIEAFADLTAKEGTAPYYIVHEDGGPWQVRGPGLTRMGHGFLSDGDARESAYAMRRAYIAALIDATRVARDLCGPKEAASAR